MRRSIFTFHRKEKPVAELHLDLCGAGSVEGWTWHGDPSVRKLIAPLPNDDQHLFESWHIAILEASEKAGLTYTRRYEGEPLIPQ